MDVPLESLDARPEEGSLTVLDSLIASVDQSISGETELPVASLRRFELDESLERMLKKDDEPDLMGGAGSRLEDAENPTPLFFREHTDTKMAVAVRDSLGRRQGVQNKGGGDSATIAHKGLKYIGPTRNNRPSYKSKQRWEWSIYPHGISRQNNKLRVQIKQKGFNPTYPSFPYTLEGLLDAALFRDHEAQRLWQAGVLPRVPKFNFLHPPLTLQPRPAQVHARACTSISTSSSSSSREKTPPGTHAAAFDDTSSSSCSSVALASRKRPRVDEDRKSNDDAQQKKQRNFPFSSAREYEKFLKYVESSRGSLNQVGLVEAVPDEDAFSHMNETSR
mmetsp:Transcript_33327/g.64933  ORF Transcript_33327/g.64933 Transcript_33327/m.64933 type:complete len:334 (-) Transcript_33327:194-1195(-)